MTENMVDVRKIFQCCLKKFFPSVIETQRKIVEFFIVTGVIVVRGQSPEDLAGVQFESVILLSSTLRSTRLRGSVMYYG